MNYFRREAMDTDSPVAALFASEHLSMVAPLPLADATLIRPDKLDQMAIPISGSVLLIAVPYYMPDGQRNLSQYAVSRDYHLYFEGLFTRLCPSLGSLYPGHRFTGAADNAPILETDAAQKAGLGDVGENGLLLTENAGSYVFLGGIYSTLPAAEYGIPGRMPVTLCTHCGACRAACPSGNCAEKSRCLSALTQKKGELTGTETAILRQYGSAWGCDRCQEVCPVNRNLRPTPVLFFHEARIPYLTPALLASMPDNEFAKRAYSWRGRAVIARNLGILFPISDRKEDGKPCD